MRNLSTETTVTQSIPSKQGKAGKYFYTLFMLIVEIAIIAIVLALHFKSESRGIFIVGIPLNIIYAIVCFAIKKGIRGLLVWWGVLALGTAIWWIYLAFINQ